MSLFQPNESDTKNIIQMLQDSRSPNPAVNLAIQKQLEEFNKVPDFNSYLAFILTSMKQQPEEIRCVAGLLLKNNLRIHFDHITACLRYISPALLQNLLDPSRKVRNITSICITDLTLRGGLKCWVQQGINLPQCLCQLLDSGGNDAVDGALLTLTKICEDSYEQLDRQENGRPVTYLVPKLTSFFQHGDSAVRKNALHSLVVLLEKCNTISSEENNPGIVDAFMTNYDLFLQGIFHLASDPDLDIRKDVCRAFIALLDTYNRLRPYIQQIMKYILVQTQSSDESVSLQACEFWSAIVEMEVASQDLNPVIPALLPVLLKNMIYSPFDECMQDAEEDAARPDRQEDIHPHLLNKAAKAKLHQTHRNEQEEGEMEDEDDDDDEKVSEWNLRKCSASTLDIMANMYGDDLLPNLLPIIQERMAQQQRWEVRESAILALGAIAEGCYPGMRQHLEGLVPYLITVLNTDAKPLVRSITCWTLSRYCRWILDNPDHKKYFEPLLHVLLNRMLDNNKKVQEAACSAFATLEEEAQCDLVPYVKPILECIVHAFQKYQAKNLNILYDAVVTLADALNRKMNVPEYIQLIMPPLVSKWMSIRDDDRTIFPLLACLTSVAQALGPGFLPYAQEVFQRCIKLISNYFLHKAAAAQNSNIEPPDREFAVCSLDMLSGLADGLESALEPLVTSSNLLDILLECMRDSASDIRQSALAFVGDLAKTCMPHLQRYLPQYMPLLIQNLTPQPVSVCNNASWAIGEIAIKIQGEIGPWVPEIIKRLIPILQSNQGLNRNLLENTGITLGRLGLVCTELVAPHLEHFIQNWCFNMRNIRNDIEKEQAFLGLCQMIRKNPNGAINSLAYICDAFASWGNPKTELKEEFRVILKGFRDHMGDQWAAYFAQFPPLLKNHLREVYALDRQMLGSVIHGGDTIAVIHKI